jgi:hypothetical protein
MRLGLCDLDLDLDRDLDLDAEGERDSGIDLRTGRLPCVSRSLLRLLGSSVSRARPRSPGLKELMRRRVLRSATGETGSRDRERLLRLLRVLSLRRGEREGERLVEMVETESSDEERERERLRRWLERLERLERPRSSSFFLRMSSATPFLGSR